jgi:release factor glutamine methyltransferase
VHHTRRAVVERLAAAGCIAATAEAAELFAAAPDEETLERWVGRREQGEPLAWIIGSVMFAGGRLAVAPGVYVPRPHTAELARRAVSRLPMNGLAVDLCTGCGAVAAHLAAAVPTATVVGVDVDERAAACARGNGVRVVVADLAGAFGGASRADLVTAVPPYVPTAELARLAGDVIRYEPRRALDGGADGLDLVRRIVDAGARLLRAGGWLFVELGGDQDSLLAPTLARAGFAPAEPWYDEDDDLRGLAARFRLGEPVSPPSSATRG